MKRHSRSTRALVEAALMIALATILGYFRLYRFPQGGSVDFAMVPILIYCLRWEEAGLAVGHHPGRAGTVGISHPVRRPAVVYVYAGGIFGTAHGGPLGLLHDL